MPHYHIAPGKLLLEGLLIKGTITEIEKSAR